MSKRAYSARHDTIMLAREVERLPDIRRVQIVPPVRNAWSTRPTRLLVESNAGQRVVMTLAQARRMLKVTA